MIPYKNLWWDSNVVAYSYDANSITVQFAPSGTSTIYVYTYASASALHVENMKKLANTGKGLNSYIGREKPKYSSKR